MKPSIKHNKLKNTGILFELLVRQITADVLKNKQNGIAVKLMREYFNSKTELGKELMLYRAFFNVQNLSEQKAFRLLQLVTEQRKTLNRTELSTQKYLLIKEIKEHFDLKEFFAARIPSYKVYASIYKTFDASLNGMGDSTTIEEWASSQFTIVEHLSGKVANKEAKEQNQLAELIRAQDDDIRYLSYKILIERFNEKYKDLNESQKELLQEYIYNVSNTNKLKGYVQKKSAVLAKDIIQESNRVTDKVIRIKLREVVAQLNNIEKATVLKENHMTAMLIGYEILKELKTL
jgi:hypothetical protein